jgi:hypothetical protein
VVFLARGVSDGVPQREGTEAGMQTRWLPLDEALRSVDTGEIHDVFTHVGLLAAERYLRRSSGGVSSGFTPEGTRST